MQTAPSAPCRTQQGGRCSCWAGFNLAKGRRWGLDRRVLVGSEGGSQEPAEHKNAKRAKKRLLLMPASG